MKTITKKVAAMSIALLLISAVLAGCNTHIMEPTDTGWVSVPGTPSTTIASEVQITPTCVYSIDDLSSESTQVSDSKPVETPDNDSTASPTTPSDMTTDTAPAASQAIDQEPEPATSQDNDQMANPDNGQNVDPVSASETDPTPSAALSANHPIKANLEYVFNNNQLLDFRSADLTEEGKAYYQSLLNTFGEPMTGAIEVKGIKCVYTNDGGLYLEAFIRNGTDKAINIYTFEPLTVMTTDRQEIASANFPGDNYGTLLPSQSFMWSFSYGKEFVLIPNADLSEFLVDAVSYYYY